METSDKSNRSGKRIHIIVSPHIDDAVLSIGGHIINWQKKKEQCMVINLFTVSNYVVGKNRLQADDAGSLRKKEEEKIGALMGFDIINFDYLEAPLRGYTTLIGPLVYFHKVNWNRDRTLMDELEKSLIQVFNKFQNSTLYFPLGPRSHIDHMLTRRLAGRLIDKYAIRHFAFYEDLPYCSRYGVPKELISSLALKSVPDKIDIDKKLEYSRMYKHGVKEKWLKEIKHYCFRPDRNNYYEQLWAPS